jgi:putative tryptophan/tyrosine transport system substrate-binding protein
MSDMKRREFIALLGAGGLLLAVKVRRARAQQPGKLPTIGFLGSNASAWSPWTADFVQRLRELGWIEGRTIAIEYRWSEGLPERNAEIAAEFVRLKVDAIVTNNFALPALTQATEVIPIVFALALDPVRGGLVASLPRPGAGNVTAVGRSCRQASRTFA